MAIYSRKNLLISAQGPSSPILQPITNGEVLVFDAASGSFTTPPSTAGFVQATNLGSGIPVFEEQAEQELFFNTLIEGDNITLSENNGEITVSSTPAIYIVPDIPSRDALAPYQGMQSFVEDAGNSENALYMWDGIKWVLLSTQDSANTDAQTFSAIVTFSSSTPVVLGSVSSGSKAFNVNVEVIQEFDDAASVLTIGTDIDNSICMPEEENDLTVPGNYVSESTAVFLGPSETILKVFFDFNDSLQGIARITVSYI